MQKVEVELRKSWIFFSTSHVLYYFQKVKKNINWASLDVEFHMLFNYIFKKALSRSRAPCAQFPTVVYFRSDQIWSDLDKIKIWLDLGIWSDQIKQDQLFFAGLQMLVLGWLPAHKHLYNIYNLNVKRNRVERCREKYTAVKIFELTFY